MFYHQQAPKYSQVRAAAASRARTRVTRLCHARHLSSVPLILSDSETQPYDPPLHILSTLSTAGANNRHLF
jgi:hypothetical protein